MAKSPTYPDVLKQARKVTAKTPLTKEKPKQFTVSTVCAGLGTIDASPQQVAEVVSILNKADPARLGKQLLAGMVKAAAPATEHRGGLVMEPRKALAFMNETYAVTFAGADVVILREHYDDELERETVSFVKPQKLELYYANWEVITSGTALPLFPWWVHHPKRRTYRQVVFAPEADIKDCFNLWRGWAFEPDPKASCKLFLEHSQDVICNGDKDLCTWLLDWLADAVQHPNTKPGTALVMKGDEGIGKGVFAQYVGRLYGPHFTHLTHSEHLVSKFNSHMKGCAFLFGDECFYAGDKKHEGVIKGLITEPTVQVEMKFIDKFPVANRVRLVLASNSSWIVPAGMSARRFCVLDVPDTRMGDTPYFKALFTELEGDGPAALMHFLRNRKITSDLRVVPKTVALFDQKRRSMDAVQSFWYGALKDGALIDCEVDSWDLVEEGDRIWVAVVRLYGDFLGVCKATGQKRRPTRDEFGVDLKRLCPKRVRSKRTLHIYNDHHGQMEKQTVYAYGFPPLAECRAAFEGRLGQEVKWKDED